MIPNTIAAIATPEGRGGIGIIRISGPQAFAIGFQIFKPHGKTHHSGSITDFPYDSHRIYFGHIYNPHQDASIDEVLVVFMKAPKTYTREDVVEIHGHGGYQTLKSILETTLEAGAVLAEPGEFTKRAYLNGRIDLTQAEAVIDLINARSNLSRKAAFSQITGTLKNTILGIRESLIDILARIQAEIEFPEDMAETVTPELVYQDLQETVVLPIQKLITNHDQSFPLTQGIKTIIIGAPNVGKSSLMNCLSRKQKSIVTPHPGTTRDLIEEHVSFCGTPMVLTDSAGLHATTDPVEAIGIDMALKQIQLADIVLFVLQAGHPISKNEHRICEQIQNKQTILIFNKTDLLEKPLTTVLPKPFTDFPSVAVSALEKTGIDLLEDAIERVIAQKIGVFQDPVVPNIRHKKLLDQTMASLDSFFAAVSDHMPPDILALDLADAVHRLGQITGDQVDFDILDIIFHDFCIGK